MRDMTWREYASSLDDILTTFKGQSRLVNFGVFGEPTLSHILVPAVQYASERGLETRVSTNVQLLDADLAEGLLKAGLRHIHLSLDEMEAERFNAIRRGLDFDVILGNVENLWETIKRGGYRCRVYVYPVVSPENRHRIRDILRFWRRYSHSCHPSPEIPIGPGHRARAWTVGLLRRWGLPLLKRWGLTPHCYDWLVVRANGDVVPCCLDVFHEHVFGNVFRQPVAEVWHGPEAEAFRDRLSRGDLPPLCERCRFRVFFR